MSRPIEQREESMEWEYLYGETGARKTVRVYGCGNLRKIRRSRWNQSTGETTSSKVAYFLADDPDQEFESLPPHYL